MKAIVKRATVLFGLAALLAFAKTSEELPDDKKWNIELIMDSGNTADIDVKITAVKGEKDVVLDYDLDKDAAPLGSVYINVEDKDDLKKVLIERNDQLEAKVKVVITEMDATTDRKILEKEFNMPEFEKDFLIIWND